MTHREPKQVIFDFSLVEEISTAAINTLIRFRNTIVHLEKTMQLVPGPGVRKQLEVALIDRVFDVHEN
ncbi:hypothetical protein MYX64_13585, partial [Nitrospinae bacterium AH_259_B05_G02_I21]|nr:hypothetical protein [Nitrospinae bacterium AH_259_B05_G02_I21]